VMRRRRSNAGTAHPSADRVALARGVADQRGAVAHGERPRRGSWQHPHPPREGRPPSRGRHGRLGVGASQPVARGAPGDARRRSALCCGWADGRAALVGNRRSGRPAPSGSVRRRSTSLRSAPAASRARGRDGPREGPARRHSAPTRPPEPASTSRGSTAARSSTPSTTVPRPYSRPAPDCGSGPIQPA
jgi:hypothetical protein